MTKYLQYNINSLQKKSNSLLNVILLYMSVTGEPGTDYRIQSRINSLLVKLVNGLL